VLASAAATSIPADAQETEVEIDPVVIEEERLPDPVLTERSFETSQDVTGFGETVYTEPSWQSFESTAELLGQSAGAQIRRQGGREDFSTLSIRGAPAGQLRVLLDGVSLGRADDAVVNLSDIPLEAVERIEIHRGTAPAGLSAASAASVVNIITKDPRGTTAGAAAGLGSFGSGKIVGYGSGGIGEGAASALASLRTTEGDYEYLADSFGIFEPGEGCVRQMPNNESDTVSALLRYRHPFGESLRVQAREHVFYKNEGVPGPDLRACPTPSRPVADPSNANLETTRSITALALEGADAAWALESSLLYQQEKLTEAELDADNVADSVASMTLGRWRRTIGSHLVGGTTEVGYETFDQEFLERMEPGASADRWSLAIAAGDEWSIPRWNLTLDLQVRHQQLWNSFDAASTGSGDDESSTDPRAGLRWEPVRGLVLKGNVGTYFRPPTFDELFGADGFTEGNPALDPESGINRDVGFEWSARFAWLSRLDLGYAYFHNDIDDVIVVLLTPQRVAVAQNVARAHVTGHEVRLEAQIPWGLALSANYTYQDAVNRTDSFGVRGRKLPSLPPHEAYARLSWPLPFTGDRVLLSYDVQVDSSHFRDSENALAPIPTRVEHGLALIVTLAGGFRLTLEADNLGNSLIPDEIGYPLPSRTFHATLSWSGRRDQERHDAS